jgi:hypothetical protein
MKLDAKRIIERLKEHYQIMEDTELSEFLGIHRQNVYNWKKRNTVDLKVILAKCRDVDLNWLFRGTPFEGSKELAELRSRVEALEKSRK